MRRKNPLRLAAAALAVGMLAACGADEAGGSNGGTAADAGEPQVGGSARIMQHNEPRSLDPALGSNTAAVNTLVGNALYGQLLVAIPGDEELEPGLAESLESTDGGTTWTLTLREGLTFSDGTPLDAADVQANWERLADPAISPGNAALVSIVDSMTAEGQVLDFTLAMPVAQFGHTIARLPMNWVAKPEALEAGNQAFDQDPIGAGPFVLQSWQRQGEMVLVRNDNYWDAPRPYLDELVLLANGDGNQRLNTVLSGGADALTSTAANIRTTGEEQGLDVVMDEDGGDVVTLTLNARMAPFDDARARQAFTQAVDWEAVNVATFDGTAIVPELLFPGTPEYNGDVTLPEHDPEAAQTLFDELAAEGTPVAFTLTSIQTSENRSTNESILAQMRQYENVSVDLEVLDYPAWLAANSQRTFQVIAGGLNSEALNLWQLLHSQSPGNATGISDPELDAALDAVLAADDQDTRVQAYQDLAATYVDAMPTVSYVTLDSALLTNDRLQGAEFYSHGAIRVDTLWVSE